MLVGANVHYVNRRNLKGSFREYVADHDVDLGGRVCGPKHSKHQGHFAIEPCLLDYTSGLR